MAFNADTYHANKCARYAKEKLAKAREMKARLAAPDVSPWEAAHLAERLPLTVADARFWAKTARVHLALRAFKQKR